MSFEFELPELGEDIESGDVVNIMISEGDEVKKDQPLMEIETDKAVIELPSPVDGRVKKLAVSKGDTIKVGQLLITFDDNSASKKEAKEQQTDKSSPDTKKPDTDEDLKDQQEKAVSSDDKVQSKDENKAKEQQVDSDKDKEEEPGNDNAKVITMSSKERSSRSVSDNQYIPASPSIRRLAREIGVDISKVTGTGPGGRITDDDVKKYSQKRLSDIEQKPVSTEVESKHTISDNERTYSEEMSKVRKLTAERLSFSWKAPHVTQHDKADITKVEEYRNKQNNRIKSSGVKITMTSILAKVLSQALRKFPKFNCSIDMDEELIIYKNYINIGIAVDTDRGLLVPVIRDADKKNIVDLSRELSDLSERSRNKKIKVEELQDSTFTISNLGGIGGTYFTPVINSPNVAILGVSRSVLEPVYIDNEFKPRLMLPLSLSYDHRIIDGADAARFSSWLVESLENPFNILMNN